MKKLSIVLISVALVAVLAAGSFAYSPRLSGIYGFEVRVDGHGANDTTQAIGRALFNATLSFGNVRSGALQVDFANQAQRHLNNAARYDRRAWEHDKPWGTDPYNTGLAAVNLQMNVTAARVVLNGALWKDGPSVTTTAGRVGLNWSPIVASSNAVHSDNPLNRFDGIVVTGFEVGGFKVDAAHGWINVAATKGDRPTIVRAAGNLDIVGLEAVVTNRETTSGVKEDRVNDFHVTAKVSPVDGIDLSGAFARDGGNEKNHYKVEAALSTIEDITLKAAVWSTDEDFGPRYAHRSAPSGALGTNNRGFYPDETGFRVDAETVQGGVKLSGWYASLGKHSDANYSRNLTEVAASTTVDRFDLSLKNETDNINGTASTTTTLGVGTKFEDIAVNYEGILKTGENMKNAVSASTTMDLIFADGVSLSGKVTQQKDADVEIKTEFDASWRAPNGLGIGVHYANYDRANELNKGATNTLRSGPYGVPVTQIGPVGSPDGLYLTLNYVQTF